MTDHTGIDGLIRRSPSGKDSAMKKAKKRRDCFFGMHFDFHATPKDREIGRDFDPDVLRDLIEQTHPDFVQCDTKGHEGYASYPSEICAHPDDIRTDILKEWRRITAEKDVLLYGHHSGVWDFLAVKMHPEWAAVDGEGTFSDQAASVFGVYADNKLIPQLCELAGKYNLDGAWIDGDCWGVVPDYSEAAKSVWREQTGKEVPPSDSPEHRAYLDFCRAGFVRYVAHYTSTVKERFPNFEIASNWLNTSYAPVDDAVTDFISGDMATTECADSARFESRVIADYHRPWDLMAWGFYPKSGNIKSAKQLCQELALVFSVGGGVQTYFEQDHLAVINYPDVVISTMHRVATFCHARRECSFGATPVPTVGVIFSAQAFFKDKERVFADWEGLTYNSGVRGMTNLILDNGCPTEILHASGLSERDLTAYSLLVLTESPDLEAGCESVLLRYVEQGGTLVLSGNETLKRFAPHFTLKIKEDNDSARIVLRKNGGVEICRGKKINLIGACTAEEQTFPIRCLM